MSCKRDIHVDLFDALPWLRRGVVLSSYCPYPFRRFVAYLRSRSCPGKCGAHEAKWPAVENRDMSTPISEIIAMSSSPKFALWVMRLKGQFTKQALPSRPDC